MNGRITMERDVFLICHFFIVVKLYCHFAENRWRLVVMKKCEIWYQPIFEKTPLCRNIPQNIPNIFVGFQCVRKKKLLFTSCDIKFFDNVDWKKEAKNRNNIGGTKLEYQKYYVNILCVQMKVFYLSGRKPASFQKEI